jgi:AGZA family xanthine/uracil permease-like MFS transporter
VVAGITTFMTMAYIIAVNPLVLAGNPAQPGPPIAATIAATCLGAAIPTLLMGLWANYPLALASGMGLNSAVIAAVGMQQGVTWQTMMGVIFLEGLVITVLVITRLREAVMNAIPLDLKRAIGVGIGLFIALLGLHQAHWMSATPPPASSPTTIAPIGNFHAPSTLLATFGLLVTALLLARRVRGAFLLGIAATTIAGIALGLVKAPSSLVALPRFTTFGKLDVAGALQPALLTLVFAFLITDFFDTMGTVIAVGEQAGFVGPDGKLPRLNRVLLVDSVAAMWGGLCSASSVTTYIESASGVGEGGRTGLTSVTVALLFLASMFFAPLIGAVPPEATAPALILVGFLMMATVREIDFRDVTAAIPAFLTLLVIPLTMSISRGIGAGFIAYALLHLFTGRGREVPLTLYLLAALFAFSFWLERAS